MQQVEVFKQIADQSLLFQRALESYRANQTVEERILLIQKIEQAGFPADADDMISKVKLLDEITDQRIAALAIRNQKIEMAEHAIHQAELYLRHDSVFDNLAVGSALLGMLSGMLANKCFFDLGNKDHEMKLECHSLYYKAACYFLELTETLKPMIVSDQALCNKYFSSAGKVAGKDFATNAYEVCKDILKFADYIYNQQPEVSLHKPAVEAMTAAISALILPDIDQANLERICKISSLKISPEQSHVKKLQNRVPGNEIAGRFSVN